MVDYPRIARILDYIDGRLVALGLQSGASWDDALNAKRLYAGKLRRGLPQYRTHIGMTPYEPSARNIAHDVTKAIPLFEKVEVYQSEDVFEHIPYKYMPKVFDHVYDALVPGGLFRLSVPDYRCDIYCNRCKREGGHIVFDPGGGGNFIEGKVVGGGHLWFPLYENIVSLIEQSKFDIYSILEGYAPNGDRIMEPVDYSIGYIQRTSTHDARVRNDPRPVSIIVDIVK